jgi:hypothetical protein
VASRRPLVLASGQVQELPSGDVLKGDLAAIVFVIDGGSSVPAVGTKAHLPHVPFACTVKSWRIVGDASGSAVVDVKRATYANFPTTSSIAGTEKPTLSAAQKSEDAALSSWTTALALGDVLEAVLDSVTTCKKVTVVLTVEKA